MTPPSLKVVTRVLHANADADAVPVVAVKVRTTQVAMILATPVVAIHLVTNAA